MFLTRLPRDRKTFAACAVSVIVAAVAAVYITKFRHRRPKRSNTPIWSDYYMCGFNDLFSLIANPDGLAGFINTRRKELEADAFIIKLPFLMGKTVVICHPDDAAAIIARENNLKLKIRMPPSYEGLHGEDLQLMSTDKHKFWRKILSAAFTPRALESYAPHLLDEFSAMWRRLKSTPQEEVIVIRDEIRRSQLRVMSRLLFGFTFDNNLINKDSEAEFEQLDADFEAESSALFSIALNVPGTAYYKALKASERIRELLMKRFETARRIRMKERTQLLQVNIRIATDISSTNDDHTQSPFMNQKSEIEDSAHCPKYRSAIDAIIDAVDSHTAGGSGHLGLKVLTAQQKLDVSNNLLLLLEAAHGTTMFATTALLGELHSPRNAHALAKVRTETVKFRDSGMEWSAMAAKTHLPYLEACINEALRLYPFAAGVPAILPAGKRIDLPHSDVTVQGPCDLLLIFAHHFIDPKVFPDPLRFQPERWYDIIDCEDVGVDSTRNTSTFHLDPQQSAPTPSAVGAEALLSTAGAQDISTQQAQDRDAAAPEVATGVSAQRSGGAAADPTMAEEKLSAVPASAYARRVFTPFGMGAHLCLGQKLALLTMKAAVFSYALQSSSRSSSSCSAPDGGGGFSLQLVDGDIERVSDILPSFIIKDGVRATVIRN